MLGRLVRKPRQQNRGGDVVIDFGKGWDGAVKLVGVIMALAIPLAIWKAVELIAFAVKHRSISFK